MEEALTARYEMLALAGRGGMGEVWRARDRASGVEVAIKRVRVGPRDAHDRFAREARVLASLEHPAIVRHIAHGADEEGAWIAMEWLEGEDLAARIAKRPLDPAAVCALGARVADALAATHARGVIHRDVKPSNVFLEGGDPLRAKLLDFGVARLVVATAPLTATRAVVGTVGYMAPEQASGRDDLDPRVDVFALGCVLYECFTGEPAFAGATPLAVLGRILCDDVPRLGDRNPELPAALDDLLARMLDKDRQRRIGSAADVASALRAVDFAASRPRGTQAGQGAITGGERRVASIIVARLPSAAAHAETMSTEGGPPGCVELASRHGARLTVLAGGHLLLALEGDGAATDRAQRAARCALELVELLRGGAVALATGGAESSGRSVLGPVVDRAAALLQRPETASGVLVDEATEGLLGAAFEVERRGEACALRSSRADVAAVRTVLGRATPFVGRERELAMLESLWRVCVAEGSASVALVSALPGMGKTRLRQELCARIAAADPTARAIVVRADPFAAGSAFRLSREIVRRGVGIVDDDPVAMRTRIGERMRALLGETDGPPVAELLVEMVGASPEEPSPRVVAARQDPSLLAEELRTAFARWLIGETTRSPLLVVVEDLHWGDAASVEHLDEALRFRDAPLMVLALARPEVREVFASPWASASPVWIELAALSPRSSERLVRGILGADAGADVVARIVTRGDGNAFYLEELARFAVDRADDTPPESVLAMVQARIAQLEPRLRRGARAASLFGETAWDGGVAATLGIDSPREARAVLDALVAKEILERARTSRYRSQVEYVFRHALVQAAAYAMLTDDDRRRGHIAAARWMVSMGDADARAIAEHFELGGAPADAVPWLAQAAHTAYGGHDPRKAIELGERAIACGAEGEERGELREMQGQAYGTLWQVPQALRASLEAIGLLPPGSPTWVGAVAGAIFLSSMGNAPLPAPAAAGLPKLMATLPKLPMTERTGQARFLLEASLLRTAQVELVTELAAGMAARSEDGATEGYRFWSDLAAFDHDLHLDHDLGALRRLSARTFAHRERITSPVGLVMSRLYRVTMLAELGAFGELWAEVPIAFADFDRFGGGAGRAIASYYVELAARAAGRPMDEASVAEIAASRAPVTALLAPCLRADRLLDVEGADASAASALVAGIERSGLAVAGGHACVVLARAAHLERRFEDALTHAEAGLAVRAHPPTLRSRLLLARVDALRMLGDARHREARDATIAAVHETAGSAEAADRASFLVLPQQRAILALPEWRG